MTAKKKFYSFNKLIDLPYKLEHIYPIKQQDIAYILEHLPPEVEKLYVFGSSLTLDCGTDSDIDLLVVAEKTDNLYKQFSTLVKVLASEVDLIFKTPTEYTKNLSDTTSICNVVEKEGLLIYERSL